MSTTNSENTYPVGSFISAKADPDLPLVITNYNQRIYYCAVVGQPDHKHFAYFERELIPPADIK